MLQLYHHVCASTCTLPISDKLHSRRFDVLLGLSFLFLRGLPLLNSLLLGPLLARPLRQPYLAWHTLAQHVVAVRVSTCMSLGEDQSGGGACMKDWVLLYRTGLNPPLLQALLFSVRGGLGQ